MFWKMRQTYRFWFCYLNQPLFNANSPAIWRLSRFWSTYQIDLLETCWEKSPIKEASQ